MSLMSPVGDDLHPAAMQPVIDVSRYRSIHDPCQACSKLARYASKVATNDASNP